MSLQIDRLREIASNLADACDSVKAAADLIRDLPGDTYNLDFINGKPMAGLTRLIAQLRNQQRHYQLEYFDALWGEKK